MNGRGLPVLACALLAALAGGCAGSARVVARDDASLRNMSMKIAVLEPRDRTGALKPAVLKELAVRKLRSLGYEHVEPASAAPRDAEFSLLVELAPSPVSPRRAADDDSVYTDASGRREYYRKDMHGEGYSGPRARATASLVEPGTGAVLYRAEFDDTVSSLSDEDLVDVLLKPLEK